MERKEDIGRMHTAGITIDFEYGELWRGLHRSNPLSFKRPFSFTLYQDRDVYMAEDWRGRIRFEDDDASEVIQSAIDKIKGTEKYGGTIWIRGAIPVNSKITNYRGVTLIGRGFYRYQEDKIYGDGLYGSVDGALLELTTESHVEGLAIVNTHDNGTGIHVNGSLCTIRMCDIFAKKYGINNDYDEGISTETKITDTRLTGVGVSGSIGINVDNSDNWLDHLIIRGFDIGVKLSRACNHLSYIHNYRFPAETVSYGVYDTSGGNQIDSCYFGGAVAGIYIQHYFRIRIFNSLIWAEPGADGIYIDPTTSRDVSRSIIKNNMFEGQGGASNPSNIAIRLGANVTGLYKTVICDNEVRYFTSIGATTHNSGTATFSGDGTTDDFSIGAHGLAVTDPDEIVVKVTPISSDAIAASPCTGYVDPADNTLLRVKFSSAPASGTDNVKIKWCAWAEW